MVEQRDNIAPDTIYDSGNGGLLAFEEAYNEMISNNRADLSTCAGTNVSAFLPSISLEDCSAKQDKEVNQLEDTYELPDRWRDALVQAPAVREVHTDGGAAQNRFSASTRDQLKEIGIAVERTDRLPEQLKSKQFNDFLNAHSTKERTEAIASLDVIARSGKEPEAHHAAMALQQARLMDAVIRLDDLEKRKDAAVGSTNFDALKKEHQSVLREIVRMEHLEGGKATTHLNGHSAHIDNVRKDHPGRMGGTGSQFQTELNMAREQERGGAIDLLRQPMKRLAPKERHETYEHCADALARLEAMADRHDRRAIDALEPIRHKVPELIADLRGADEKKAQAAKIELENGLNRSPELGLNAKDILKEVKLDDLRAARESERQACQENINGVAGLIGEFSSPTASRNLREQLLAKAQQKVEEEQRLTPVVDWMESMNAKLSILETKRPDEAAAIIRGLHKFSQNPLSDGANVCAGQALAMIVGEKDSLDSLIRKLDNRDPAVASQALREVQARLPRKEINNDLNDHQSRSLLATLPQEYQAVDVDKLIQKLEPIAKNNPHANDVLQWASAEAELKRIEELSRRSDARVEIDQAVGKLLNLADSNNKYARLAISGMLLDDEAELRKWNNDVLAKNSERPLAIECLRHGTKNDHQLADAARLQIAHYFEAACKKDPQRLNEAEASACAIASIRANNSSVMRSVLFRALDTSVEKNEKVSEGLVEAMKIREAADDSLTLSKLYIKGMSRDRMLETPYRDRANQIREQAQTKSECIEIVTAVACGHGSIPGDDKLAYSTRYDRDRILYLSTQEQTREQIKKELKSVGEAEVKELEKYFDLKNPKACTDICTVHEFMAEAYWNCGDRAEAARHRYEAAEIRRAMRSTEKTVETNPILLLFSSVDKLPRHFDVNMDRNSLHVDLGKGRWFTGTQGLLQIAESIPGYRISKPVHDLLASIEKIDLRLNDKNGELRIAGQTEISLPPEMLGKAAEQGPISLQGAAIILDNLSCKVAVKDGAIELTEIQGLFLKTDQFQRLPFNRIKVSVDNSNPAEPRLQLRIQPLMAPEPTVVDLPISKAQAQQFALLVDELGKPDGSKDLRKLPAMLAGLDQNSPAVQLLQGSESFSRKADTFHLAGKEDRTVLLGGQKLHLSKDGEFTLDSKNTRVKDIKGIGLENPFPAEMQKKLHLEGPVNVRDIHIEKYTGKNGERVVQIQSDAPLKSVTLKVDKDLKPITDEISFELSYEGKEVKVNLSLLEEKKGMDGDWRLSLDGATAAKKNLLEAVGAPPKVAEALKDVRSISKSGDKLAIVVGKPEVAEITIPADIGKRDLKQLDWQLKLVGDTDQNKKLLGDLTKSLGIDAELATKLDVRGIKKSGSTLTIEIGKPQVAEITLPIDIADKGLMKSDWKLKLSGGSAENNAVLQQLGLSSQLADAFKESEVVCKKGNTIERTAAAPTALNIDGLKLKLGKDVTVKFEESGHDIKLKLDGVQLSDVPLDEAPDLVKGLLKLNIGQGIDIEELTLTRDEKGNIKRITIDKASKLIKSGSYVEFDEKMEFKGGELTLSNPVSNVTQKWTETELKIELERKDGKIQVKNPGRTVTNALAGSVSESNLVKIIAPPVAAVAQVIKWFTDD